VRYLTQVKLVTRSREPGSRRDIYLVEHEVFYRATANRDGILMSWIARLDQGITAVPPGSEAAERLIETREFMRFLLTEMTDMLERWDRRKVASLATSPTGSAAPVGG
jgi:DNA-binding transcriptional regulator GbsR (MarR family)